MRTSTKKKKVEAGVASAPEHTWRTGTTCRSQLFLPPRDPEMELHGKFPNSHGMAKPVIPVRPRTDKVHSVPGCLCEIVVTNWALGNMKQLTDNNIRKSFAFHVGFRNVVVVEPNLS